MDRPPADASPALDGPRWEIAYAQEVLRVCAKQHVQTGMFDTPTCAAVKSVQRFFGQKADGIIGPRMWGLLHYREDEDEAIGRGTETLPTRGSSNSSCRRHERHRRLGPTFGRVLVVGLPAVGRE